MAVSPAVHRSNGIAIPVPIGVTASFSPLEANATTPQFWLDQGEAIITWCATDVNNPGVLTLADQNSNTILTMRVPNQYYTFVVPVGGLKYTFSGTARCALVAATMPNMLR